MTEKIVNIIKSGTITIPKLLLVNYKRLKLTEQELILIIYFIGNNEFDPERISKDLGLSIGETLKIIDDLTKKDILKISTRSAKVYEEYINLDELYNKLALTVMENKEEPKRTNIYDKFENEFGRTLSPMEYEIIGAWIEGGFSEELIEAALKEAVYNGVSNLRYIDKILYEWQKKGIKTPADINQKKEPPKPKGEVFDYDWLNDKDWKLFKWIISRR